MMSVETGENNRSWDEWEMRLERQNDEKRRDKIRKYIKWDQKIKWYETGKEEMKRWDLEEEKNETRKTSCDKDVRKVSRRENKRWVQTSKMRRSGKEEIRWNVKIMKKKLEVRQIWKTRWEKTKYLRNRWDENKVETRPDAM